MEIAEEQANQSNHVLLGLVVMLQNRLILTRVAIHIRMGV